MDEQLYRETLLDIFRNPKNRGEIKDPDLEAKLFNPLCGDEMKIQIKLNKDKVGKAVFSGNGCAISQASASLLTSYIVGKRLKEIKNLSSKDVLELLKIQPSPARLKCALLSLETLREALREG